MSTKNKERLIFSLLLLIGSISAWFRFGQGAGNNWDGIFPYWGEQIPTWVSSLFSSWNQTGLGGPVTYTTGTLVTLLYYPLYLLLRSPELILFIVVALLLSGAAYGVFLLIRHLNPRMPFWAVTLLAMISVLNPAIFYKLLAGHLYYLVGYFGFVYLLLVLITQTSWTKRSAVLLGLIIALTASQIQFFVFSLIALFVWWVANRRVVHHKYLIGAFSVALLIHSYWISGFIFGVHNITGLSQWASQNSFGGLSSALYQNIVRLNFSDGTFINRFYGGPLSLAGLALVALIPYLLIGGRRQSKTTLYFLTLFVVFVFLSTGVFHQYNVPILGLLFPMLREVGHAAPLVVLTLLLVIGSIGVPQVKVSRVALSLFLVAVVGLNLMIYWLYVPRISFSKARAEFGQFYAANQIDGSTHRQLTYPFFNQYRFINQDQIVKMGTPMSNTGWDSFTIFSGKEYIDNAVQADPSIFQQSIQYRFITSYDTRVLAPYNVKYIYDYSKIYESYFEDFTPKSVFGGEVNVVQNDPNFTKKVIENNPNDATEIAPGIIKLRDVLPRLFAPSSTFIKVTPTEYRITIPSNQSGNINLLSNYHPGWKLVKETDADKAVLCDNPIRYENGANECLGQSKIVSGNELELFFSKGISPVKSTEFGYSNSWPLISDGSDSVTYTIFFTHQTRYLMFLMLSGTTVTICVIYLLLSRKEKALAV